MGEKRTEAREGKKVPSRGRFYAVCRVGPSCFLLARKEESSRKDVGVSESEVGGV